MFARKIVRQLFLCCVAATLVLQTGCVRRRLMIRSNPPGATVYVDNQPIGATPCATDFVYYGTREIRLVKAGYETLTVNQPIPAPWYEIPPFDFVSENLLPRKIQDYRTVSFNMVPQVIVPTEQLLGRAEQLRQSTLQGAVLPASTASIPGVVTPGMPAASAPGIPGPVLGQPTLAPPPNVVPEGLAPRLPSPGTGFIPPGGQPLEALPSPQPR
ncbi:MAG: PEGA domain-containing protein [Pirellulales bacterium]|nr:PEGA domain-containing protein [Pirellulales bacterium]